ncbi:MAG: (NiFe) hydrogenase maturation protein HypF, partial [candidate division NC10 bacterium]|nr:(NiFe) hydrogenase maturation protein HypF [candidate division NC10 bacterium]
YPFRLEPKDGTMVLDWEPLIRSLVAGLTAGSSVAVLAARFHNTLAEMIVAVAGRQGVPQIALSGGCFQNRYLTERVVRRLIEAGYSPHWHQRVPPNDGGIALGQIMAAAQRKE